MNIQQIFDQLLSGSNLTAQHMETIITACMSGELSDIQIASFLVMMRMKGETIEELTTAARVMQGFARTVDLGDDLIDIVGTGGDGKNTFNVSTASCFVVASTGIKVAKHGGRSVSSSSGSADLLEQAGFNLNLTDAQLINCIEKCNLAFLFAPHYHPALEHAKKARKELGFRTLFNLLGPLINPAKPKKQVIGVFSSSWLYPIANVLANLGSTRTLVLHAQDGLDEISIAAITDVVEYQNGNLKAWTINPENYGLGHPSLDAIVVKSPAESLDLIKSLLAGKKGPARDMVILNAAAAIYCANNQLSFTEAIEKATLALDNGDAANCFNELNHLTRI